MKTINTKLLVAYKLKGLTAKKIARQAGIEETRFCRIVSLKLKPTTEEKRTLAKLLKKPQKDLF